MKTSGLSYVTVLPGDSCPSLDILKSHTLTFLSCSKDCRGGCLRLKPMPVTTVLMASSNSLFSLYLLSKKRELVLSWRSDEQIIMKMYGELNSSPSLCMLMPVGYLCEFFFSMTHCNFGSKRASSDLHGAVGNLHLSFQAKHQ